LTIRQVFKAGIVKLVVRVYLFGQKKLGKRGKVVKRMTGGKGARGERGVREYSIFLRLMTLGLVVVFRSFDLYHNTKTPENALFSN